MGQNTLASAVAVVTHADATVVAAPVAARSAAAVDFARLLLPKLRTMVAFRSNEDLKRVGDMGDGDFRSVDNEPYDEAKAPPGRLPRETRHRKVAEAKLESCRQLGDVVDEPLRNRP